MLRAPQFRVCIYTSALQGNLGYVGKSRSEGECIGRVETVEGVGEVKCESVGAEGKKKV